jgi:hypothetical protein
MGKVRKNKLTTGQLTPQLPYLFFLTLNPVSKSAMLVTTANQQKLQGGYSKYDLCRNICYRSLGQFIAQCKKSHLMKPLSHCGSLEIYDLQSTEKIFYLPEIHLVTYLLTYSMEQSPS